MNILLTNRCNRRCPYCFAAERISYPREGDGEGRAAPELISRPDFETAVRYAVEGKMRHVGILGGEPSLHPEFVDLVTHAWDAGLDTRIFTNGMWSEPGMEAFAAAASKRPGRARVVLNVNHPDASPAEETRAQGRFLEALGKYCALSYNIWRWDLDPTFLVDIVQRYDTRRDIRLGVAQPLAAMSNEHIRIEDYRRMAPMLVDLAKACDEGDVVMGFDCGFTLCMLSPEEIGTLFMAGTRIRSSCGPVVDVGTDLTVWACFPLSTLSHGDLLTDFPGTREVVDHFRKRFGRLYRTGAMPECAGCRYRRRRQCTGGCAAHVYRSLNP